MTLGSVWLEVLGFSRNNSAKDTARVPLELKLQLPPNVSGFFMLILIVLIEGEGNCF